MKYLGVSQSCHGHEYRYIFDEDTLSKNIYNGGAVPDEDCNDCLYPIGGSNSSATFIQYLPDDDSIKAFLTGTADGPDSEDPTLVDIGEYILSVANDSDDCTDVFMQRFNLSYSALEQFDDSNYHRANVEKMARFLQSKNYTDFDWNNPFYGKNRGMRYSELCDLCEFLGMKI